MNGVKEHDNTPGQVTVFQGFPKEEMEEFEKWCEDNNWCKNEKRLYAKMKSSQEYEEFKKQYAIEKKKYTKQIVKGKVIKILAIISIFIILALVLAVPAYWFDLGKISNILVKLVENFLYPACAAIAGTLIIEVLIKSNNNT